MCGVCRCEPLWLYACRPEHDLGVAHAERFLDAAKGDGQQRARRGQREEPAIYRSG